MQTSEDRATTTVRWVCAVLAFLVSGYATVCLVADESGTKIPPVRDDANVIDDSTNVPLSPKAEFLAIAEQFREGSNPFWGYRQ